MSPTRRDVLAGLSAPVAAELAPFVRPAAATTAHPDAALLALREPWIQTLQAYGAALDKKEDADALAMSRWPAFPAFGEWQGDDASFTAETARVQAARAAISAEAGCGDADQIETDTLAANTAIVDQIAATPAQTLAGLAFKAEVSAEWLHDRESLTDSIMDDIARLAGSA